MVESRSAQLDATAAAAPDAWRRRLGFMLDGFRASAAHTLPAPPLGPDEVAKAMRMNGR